MSESRSWIAEPVDGIVLAAGLSRRMGRPKPLLELEGETFIERAVRTLREGGCRAVVAVVGGGDAAAARLAAATGAVVVANGRPSSEPIDSIRLGLDALSADAVAAAVLPVDHPLVRSDTVAALVEGFRDGKPPVVRPVHRGCPGHPGIFGRATFAALRRPALPDGAQTVIAEQGGAVLDLEVSDPGVLGNVDTPEDFERLIGG